jgi:uncharacterized membrane protein
MAEDVGHGASRVAQLEESALDRFREAAFRGVAVVVPVLVTLYVLNVAVGVATGLLEPLKAVLDAFEIASNVSEIIIDVVGIVAIVALTVLVGVVAEFNVGERVIEHFDEGIQRVPGVGAVYKSFRQMSDVMLESDADNFQSVKLVEFPHSDAYTLGFTTTDTPDPISSAAGYEEMQTLFLPLAPNPVMGGHLTHVPEDQVMDVDMTVEEGMRTIVTMGVAISAPEGEDGLSRERLEELTGQSVADSKTNGESS